MQATDRTHFAKLMETLCAGFNVPATEARSEAYWRGLKSLRLLDIEAVVDRVLGPQGDEDELPTPMRLYAINRKIRAEQRAAELAGRKKPDEPPQKELDRFDTYTSQVMFAVLCEQITKHGSGATEESLAQMLHVKHHYASSYRELCKADESASLELRDKLREALTDLFVSREPSKYAGAEQARAAGSAWDTALAAVAASNIEGGHNAPIGSPQWRVLPPLRA